MTPERYRDHDRSANDEHRADMADARREAERDERDDSLECCDCGGHTLWSGVHWRHGVRCDGDDCGLLECPCLPAPICSDCCGAH